MAVVIDAAGQKVQTILAPTLSDLQKAVGGFIEIVMLDPQHLMIVNEDHGTIDLPLNPVATQMACHVVKDTNFFGNAVFLQKTEIRSR